MQRVTRARHWHFVEAQWFADQGFAVVIADGAGTPGRGPSWAREIYGDVLSPVIDDQLAALYGAAEHCPDLDLNRVAIRGWSYGGMLSLACVLRRPDVFHAAVAGAAPVDMHLYDTHYRERYLGHPDTHEENYWRCSVVHEAASLRHPLLIIHGLRDDNVMVANALRMSAALLAAGKHHEVLLLPGATHITVDPEVDVNLYLYELQFLRRSLGPAKTRKH
jgi:dipeptidyl-peptidase-4